MVYFFSCAFEFFYCCHACSGNSCPVLAAEDRMAIYMLCAGLHFI